MSEKKLIVVDIDDFEERLNYRFCEDDEWNWTIDDLFEEIEIEGQTEEHHQLSQSGIDKILGVTIGLLNDLDYDQNSQKVPLDEQALNLCYEIEKLPASEQQTKVSILAANLLQRINANNRESKVEDAAGKRRSDGFDSSRT